MKVFIVGHSGWALANYRMPVVDALIAQGMDVSLVCPMDAQAKRLQAQGYRVLPWHIRTLFQPPLFKGMHTRLLGMPLLLLAEGLAVLDMARLYRRERPDVVHHFSSRPAVYGAAAARLAGVPAVINNWTGLGLFFAMKRWTLGFRLARYGHKSPGAHTITHTRHELGVLLANDCLDPQTAHVIRGSGVDTHQFQPTPKGNAVPVAVLPARLMWEKGIREYVEAARILKARNVPIRMLIAGSTQIGQRWVPESQLRQWEAEGLVEWLGHVDDMPSLYAQADIAVLPSYHEGVPKVLQEAAACGLPLVATDLEGCRAVVTDWHNGFLVQPQDAASLAAALCLLASSKTLREEMGFKSRSVAVERFAQERIVEQYLEVYQQMGLIAGTAPLEALPA